MENYEGIPFQQIELTAGFWHKRQKLNSAVTLPAVLKQFKETGRFDAFRFEWKAGMPNKPHIFYDSDVAKWIESAAFILESEQRPELEAVVDEVVDLIEQHQEENGYFNIWFTVGEPDQRFKRRTEHELYCAGHLFEAAVAYHRATGKDKFLRLMCKYADHIEKAFKTDQSAAFKTPGHEEIELALVKLYDATGEERYLALSKWFIDERGGTDTDFYDFANARYAQDHLPVREQTTAEGHSVRAMYLYAGMADIAHRYNDAALFKACETLFDNTVNRRMYITGGIGSSRHGEAFTVDFDLPNTTAYAETCAALSLALFARRMLVMDADSKYADAIERVIYNGFLSGVSLDGKSFFYENPLEIDLSRIGRDASVEKIKEQLPITQRLEVFSCSCCPPNITRFIASIGDFLYTRDEQALFIHQYMDSKAAFMAGERRIEIVQKTAYPADGAVQISVAGAKGMRISVRIPGWCNQYALKANGREVTGDLSKGYLSLVCDSDQMELSLQLTMKPMLYEAHRKVRSDEGKAALMRGPVVYCIEGIDHSGSLSSLYVDEQSTDGAVISEEDGHGVPVIVVDGWCKGEEDMDALYQPISSQWTKQKLRYIPYFAFANRGESDMRVWVNRR